MFFYTLFTPNNGRRFTERPAIQVMYCWTPWAFVFQWLLDCTYIRIVECFVNHQLTLGKESLQEVYKHKLRYLQRASIFERAAHSWWLWLFEPFNHSHMCQLSIPCEMVEWYRNSLGGCIWQATYKTSIGDLLLSTSSILMLPSSPPIRYPKLQLGRRESNDSK